MPVRIGPHVRIPRPSIGRRGESKWTKPPDRYGAMTKGENSTKSVDFKHNSTNLEHSSPTDLTLLKQNSQQLFEKRKSVIHLNRSKKVTFLSDKQYAIFVTLSGFFLFVFPLLMQTLFQDDNWLMLTIFVAFGGLMMMSFGGSNYAKLVANFTENDGSGSTKLGSTKVSDLSTSRNNNKPFLSRIEQEKLAHEMNISGVHQSKVSDLLVRQNMLNTGRASSYEEAAILNSYTEAGKLKREENLEKLKDRPFFNHL